MNFSEQLQTRGERESKRGGHGGGGGVSFKPIVLWARELRARSQKTYFALVTSSTYYHS